MRKMRLLSLVVVATGMALPAWCGISPAKVEIDFGPFPIDKYQSMNLDSGTAIIPSCATNITVQQCVLNFFDSAKPNSYTGSNAVTGVRFFFALGGNTYSAPFNVSFDEQTQMYSFLGLRGDWVANLRLFLQDLKSKGIVNVSPTPILASAWSGDVGDGSCRGSCNVALKLITDSQRCEANGPQLKVYPWLPFALEGTNNWPEVANNNDGYNCGSANPKFWGWDPFFQLVDAVLQAGHDMGLTVADFDVQNEIDLINFTVLGRLIFDNKHPAQGTIFCKACSSPYIMVQLPVAYTEPSVTNIHSHVCVDDRGDTADCSGNDATSTATSLYNGVWNFLHRASAPAARANNYLVFGETNHTNTLSLTSCAGATQKIRADENVAGFNASLLHGRTNTVLRVWNNIVDGVCYVHPNVPNIINPPYTP